MSGYVTDQYDSDDASKLVKLGAFRIDCYTATPLNHQLHVVIMGLLVGNL